MFKKSKSALFLMGSFLGGLGASFVSYAAIDAGSLLDEVDLLDDFDDDNLGRLVPDSKVNNTTSTDLNLKKNSPFSKSTYDSNISEPSSTEAYVDPTTDSGDSGKISNPSLEGEFDKNLDTNVLPSPEVVDTNDSLYSNNNLKNTPEQDINNPEDISTSYVNNGPDDNLNPPVELGKDVTDTGNLSDLYQKDSNSNKLDTPVAPISDVLKPTEQKELPKYNNNNGKNKKNVKSQNNGLKLLGGLAAGMVGPLALIKCNKNLKSSGLVDKLGGLIDKVRNKWIPADTGTSDDNKNQELKEPQQTDEKKSKEESSGSVAPSNLNTPETGKAHVPGQNGNADQDQDGNRSKGTSTFGILVRILGIGIIAVLSFYFLRDKLKKEKEIDKEKKCEKEDNSKTHEQIGGKNEEKNNTDKPTKKEKSLVQQLRENFESGDNNMGVGKDSTEDNKNKEIKRSKSTKNILAKDKKEQFGNKSIVLTNKNLADILAEKEKNQKLKEEAVKNAVDKGVSEEKVEEIIKKECPGVFTYQINVGDLNIKENLFDLKKEVHKKLMLEKGDLATAIEQQLPGVVKKIYGDTINEMIEETKSKLEKEKLLAAQKVIDDVVIPDNVKKTIKEVFKKDLETYHISVDEIYKEKYDEDLKKQIDAKEIVQLDQNGWKQAVEKKLEEKVENKYKDIVRDKIDEVIKSAQSCIDQCVTAENVKEVAKSILTENGIIKRKIEEKEKEEENAVLRKLVIDNLCAEGKLSELKRKITAGEIAKVERTAWKNTINDAIKGTIIEKVISKIKKIQKNVKIFLEKKILEKKKKKLKEILENKDTKYKQTLLKNYLIKYKDKVYRLLKLYSRLKKIVEKIEKNKEDFKKIRLEKWKDNVKKMQRADDAKAAIEKGVTKENVEKIIRDECIKKSKAITADEIYPKLGINIENLKKKIKVEVIAKLEIAKMDSAVLEKLKKVVESEYGKKIRSEIQEKEKASAKKKEGNKKRITIKNRGEANSNHPNEKLVYPKTGLKNPHNKISSPLINKTNKTNSNIKEAKNNIEEDNKKSTKSNLFNKFGGNQSDKKSHVERNILHTNNNIIRPNNFLNYSPYKNEIIINDLSNTNKKIKEERKGGKYNTERKNNHVRIDSSDCEEEKTERESNTEKKPPLPYRRKYTIKVDNSSELKNKMFEKTVPFENIKEIFTKYRDKLVELGKENYKKDGSTFSVESSDMKELKLTYYWKNGKVCNSGSFILEQKRQGKKEVWIFSHNVEKSADCAKKGQKEICKTEELRPQCLKTVFENMSSFFKKITCCSSSLYVKYMNKTNKFVFENDIKADIPYDKYGYNNHNNYYNNNDY